MTIFELFPWLLAISVAVLTGTFLARAGMSGALVWIIAVAAGIASFVAYGLALRRLVSRCAQQRKRREKQETENREYQQFDAANSPVGDNLFYECLVCGNAIPSMPKKDISCKCRNIVIDAKAAHIEIRERAKVKLFSLATP